MFSGTIWRITFRVFKSKFLKIFPKHCSHDINLLKNAEFVLEMTLTVLLILLYIQICSSVLIFNIANCQLPTFKLIQENIIMKTKIITIILLIVIPFIVTSQWEFQNPIPSNAPLNDIFFIDYNHGWAVGISLYG